MPVFRSGSGLAPPWCELERFDIVELLPGESYAFERVGQKQKVIVGKGRCRIAVNGVSVTADEGASLDLETSDGQFEVLDVYSDATLISMDGRWGEETGGSGIFTVSSEHSRLDTGDPVDYPKETTFDNHYHDCDEYWILYQGRGIAASEGKQYEVGPGDCVATGSGHHHDFPRVFESVKAVFFETTMQGQKRRSHLWDHSHGPAEPLADRV